MLEIMACERVNASTLVQRTGAPQSRRSLLQNEGCRLLAYAWHAWLHTRAWQNSARRSSVSRARRRRVERVREPAVMALQILRPSVDGCSGDDGDGGTRDRLLWCVHLPASSDAKARARANCANVPTIEICVMCTRVSHPCRCARHA